MKSLQTQPSILSAAIGFLIWLSVFLLIYQQIDWDIITYSFLSISIFTFGSIGVFAAFSYSLVIMNNYFSTHYRLIEVPKLLDSKESRIDHIISLIFLYKMSPFIINLAISALLKQLHKTQVKSTIFISASDLNKYDKEVEIIRDLLNRFLEKNPQAEITIKTVPQKDGKGKKLGAISPTFRYIREELFLICSTLYGDRFDEGKARSIKGAKQMKRFLEKNDFRIPFYYVDGDTVLPPTQEVNFFQQISNVLFDKSHNCIAVTTDNLAICPPNHRGKKSFNIFDKILDYIYIIYTIDIRYLARVINLTSTKEVTTVTGRTAATNAMILFDLEFTKVVENSSNYEFGTKVYYLTGDDKDTRKYYHQLGMRALFLSYLYVYSVEEEPLSNNGNWTDFTLPGTWKVSLRTGKNGMRFAKEMFKSKEKIPLLLRFRYFMQAYVFFSPIIGPSIAYFATAIVSDNYFIFNSGVCFWLIVSNFKKMFEISYAKLLRWNFHPIDFEQVILFILLLPQTALLTRIYSLIIAIQRSFTRYTLDIGKWNRTDSKTEDLSGTEIFFRKCIGLTQLITVITVSFLYTLWGIS